jgi:hypothetical protein
LATGAQYKRALLGGDITPNSVLRGIRILSLHQHNPSESYSSMHCVQKVATLHCRSSGSDDFQTGVNRVIAFTYCEAVFPT